MTDNWISIGRWLMIGWNTDGSVNEEHSRDIRQIETIIRERRLSYSSPWGKDSSVGDMLIVVGVAGGVTGVDWVWDWRTNTQPNRRKTIEKLNLILCNRRIESLKQHAESDYINSSILTWVSVVIKFRLRWIASYSARSTESFALQKDRLISMQQSNSQII